MLIKRNAVNLPYKYTILLIMNFKVSSTALYSRLAAASKVMVSKNSMPILDCFLLEIKDNRITITASDSEKYFTTYVPAIEQNGEAVFCIPSKTIMESIKELAEQPLDITFNESTSEITGVHSCGTFSVMAQDAAPYPMCQPLSGEASTIHLKSETLLNGINRCLFATANDEIRLVMNGVYMDIKPDMLIFAGTDGRKLVKNTVHTVQCGFGAGVILSKKVCNILKNVLDKNEEEITLSFDTDKAEVASPDMKMSFRLIEGKYPNYNAVIPSDNPYKAVVDRFALMGALKRVSVFCNQSSGMVKLELGNNSMKLTGQDYEYSTSAEENLMCSYEGPHVCIGFSAQFMLEMASILEGESVQLELADPSRPGVMRPAEEDANDEVLMLIMPMRVE